MSKTTLPNDHKFRHQAHSDGHAAVSWEGDDWPREMTGVKKGEEKERKSEGGNSARIADSIIRGRRKDRAGSFVGSLSGFVRMIYMQS